MGLRILILQGHPDCHRPHLCQTLAQAYAEGAGEGGHSVEVVEPGRLVFPLLISPAEWHHGTLPPQLAAVQEAIRQADHLVLLYPLWLGDMPAMLKGFLEQVARPGFAVNSTGIRLAGEGLLRGRTARVVVSTPLAAPVYRWLHGAHSLKLVRRSIFAPAGIGPMRATVVGNTDALSDEQVDRWRERLRRLGQRAR